VVLAYQRLKETIPSLGVVLDCCMKSSHDLGRGDHSAAMFDEMRGYLVEHGISRVIVACPNCYKMFARYGTGLSTRTVYEIFATGGLKGGGLADGRVTVHDPCAVRFEEKIHDSVRDLIRNRGYEVEEMAHAGRRTLCCGEGGAVGFLAPDFAANWAELRHGEAAGRKVVTYCAGCATRLGKVAPTLHVLDILWQGEDDRPGRVTVTKSPFTYWKRLRLKKWFREHVAAAVTRERTFAGKDKQKKGGIMKFVMFLLLLVVVIITVRTSGLSRYLEEETLRNWIRSYGTLAPENSCDSADTPCRVHNKKPGRSFLCWVPRSQ
jgi:hypothetical protein